MLHMLGLSHDPLAVTPALVRQHGQRVCSSDWQQLLQAHPGVMPYKAQRACFASAFIYFLLTEVYAVGVHEKGIFVPLDAHKHYELSWVLGAVVAEVLPEGSVVAADVSR